MIDGDDIQGDGVNLAARLEALAASGGICVSGSVHEQVRDKVDEVFEDLGEQQVKNIDRPVQVWQWLPKASSAAPDRTESVEPLALPEKPSIVVLPFDNMSGDAEQAYFADGITEDITTELSRFRELFVIARNTAFTYKNRDVNVIEVARELGVHYVLEGSVRKLGPRVRINAQLIDGQDGNHLWAERYDGLVEDIFDLQDQVTRQVASATAPHIKEAERIRVRRGERKFDEAFDLAWRAVDEWTNAYRSSDRAMGLSARDKAYRAIAMNENCLPAYSVICYSIWQDVLLQWTDDRDASLAEIRPIAETFVRNAPNSHLAHFCHGIWNMMARHMDAAVQDFRHSIELNGNDPNVQAMLATVEANRGNLEAAKEVAKSAIRLSPKDPQIGTAYLALALAAFAERDPEFPRWAEKAILAQPNAPIRRALMIAYAAEIGDAALMQKHKDALHAVAPRFLPRVLSGERPLFRDPEVQARLLKILRNADLTD